MNITAVSSRSCISAISRTMRAWMVTSSAVVGSSAITSFGLLAKAMRDQHALAHAAGELMRIAREQVGAVRQVHRVERGEHAVAPVARRDADARQMLVELRGRWSAPD